MIAITGAPGITDTVNLSTAVTGIVFSEVSLGQPGVATQYTFDQGFSIEACGPNAVFGGGCITHSGDTLLGHVSDGTILFTGGPATSLSFTSQNPEFWNGFTIGLIEGPTLRLLSRSLTPWLWLYGPSRSDHRSETQVLRLK